MRLVILFALILLIDWFSFQGVRFLVQSLDRPVRTGIYVAFWFVPIATILYMLAGMQGLTQNWPKGLTVFLRTFILILYFSKFLMGSVILIDDIRRLFMWAIDKLSPSTSYSSGRSRFLTQLGLALGSLPLLSLTYGVVRNPYRYKVYEQDVKLSGVSRSLDGLKVVQISDIHSGSFLFKEPVERSVEIINDLEPDIVFFTGDLVNSVASEMDDYIDVFGKIKAKHGVYSILGNHDYGDYHDWPDEDAKRENFEYLKEQHRKMGWRLLMNEHEVIEINGARLGVIGVENYSANRRFHKYGDLAKAVSGMPETDMRILLSHDPSHWHDQVTTDYKSIDLTLSGHTHGFQFGVEIPGFIKWSPVQYVYKEWAGLYQEGAQALYVNRGLGYLGYPGRVGILPEISLLTMRSVV